MSASSWRAALRIARREAWRSKGRSLLVIALIGLPIFALAGADVVYRTWQLSPTQKISRELGSASASVQWIGGPLSQTPTGDATSTQNGDTAPAPSTAQLVSRLPAGARAIEQVGASSELRIRTAAGIELAGLNGLDYADPIAHGLIDQVSGRAPRNGHEVALTTSLAAATGLHVGDTMHTADPSADYTVVGLIADAGYRGVKEAYTVPAGVDASSPGIFGSGPTWLISTPGPVTWDQVKVLNQAGYVVVSRWVYLHRPPKSELEPITAGSSNSNAQVFATGALIAGMALLEIVLLAGPAFAVGARRQRRDLALIAAVGGDRRELRNVVLSTGIVLGVASGIISALAGIGGAALAEPLLGRYDIARPGPFEVRPLDLAALVVLALLTALAAAVFPARAAARLDVVATLAGRRGSVHTRKRVPVIGAVLAGIGVVIALGAGSVTDNSTVILAGIALAEVGLIVCTPSLLGLAARFGRLLPVSGRIALRDAGRNRSAAAPAVAAVMASVIGAVAIVLGVSSANDQDRRNYQPSLAMNATYVAVSDQKTPTPQQVAAVLRAKLPTTSVAVINQPADECQAPTFGDPPCKSTTVSAVLPPALHSRYRGGAFPAVLIDDGSGVEALLGTADPSAVAALRAGKVLVVDPGAIHNGLVALQVDTTYIGNGTTVPPDETKKFSLPAAGIDGGFPAAQVIMPPAVAARLGVVSTPTAVLAGDSRAPTDRERQAVQGALSELDATGFPQVETGYQNPSVVLLYALIAVAALIAVGAAIIATALSNADSRPDLITLAAIGASPRTRRLLSLSRAATIAGIGTVLGTAAGFVVALAWVHSAHRSPSFGLAGGGYFVSSIKPPSLRLVVPTVPITLAVIGIPVIAALIAFASGRSRLPSERPAE